MCQQLLCCAMQVHVLQQTEVDLRAQDPTGSIPRSDPAPLSEVSLLS